MIITAVTGHRPEGLLDLGYVRAQLHHAFNDLKSMAVCQGMAPGTDLLAARVAYDMGLPVISVRPWAGHSVSQEWSRAYDAALRNSASVVTLDPDIEYPGPQAYHRRNRFMVDNADTLVAVWDGRERGGTYQTVRYALEAGVPVYQIYPHPRDNDKVGWIAQD